MTSDPVFIPLFNLLGNDGVDLVPKSQLLGTRLRLVLCNVIHRSDHLLLLPRVHFLPQRVQSLHPRTVASRHTCNIRESSTGPLALQWE